MTLGVISNGIFDLIKHLRSNKSEQVIPIEIVIEGATAKATISASMTKEQVHSTINELVNAVLKQS